MFKFVALSVLFAVAAARPGYLESSPVVYSSPIVHDHHSFGSYGGSYIKSLPSTVSHHSSSVIHDSAHYVEPIIAPVVKTYATPIVKSVYSPHTSYSASPIHHHSYAAASPIHHSYSAGSPIHHSFSAPSAHYEYLESAPAHYSFHDSTPDHYSFGHSSPFSYASSW